MCRARVPGLQDQRSGDHALACPCRDRLLIPTARLCQVLLSTHASLQPNAQTYAALMRPLAFPGSVRNGDTGNRAAEAQQNMQTAFALYEELLGQEVPPDHVVYNMLIGACGEAKDFAAAEGIFTEMREKVPCHAWPHPSRAGS